tara:strand:- start:7786 stop:8871 length:1086 start_codon:yes stop_codon:yes gene_type:complete
VNPIPEEYIKKIIHVDMDAFYASVEQRDRPELRGKPIAVGGSKERGVVAAASYEARKYGVRSAMPSAIAWRRCPDIIFLKPDFKKYRAVSQQIRSIFHRYTDLVEPLSLDEAYLDVSQNKAGISSASKIARKIREEIKTETELNASAGISINKFLAKVASDINKPNGQKTIMPDEVISFLEGLPIQKFFGVGAKTAEKMKRLGIHNGKDLKAWDIALLKQEFGKAGEHYFNIVRGLQKSEVKPSRARKSLGAERTFDHDLKSSQEVEDALRSIFEIWYQRIEESGLKGRTISLKLKSQNFETLTRSKSLEQASNSRALLFKESMDLLRNQYRGEAIRLLGLSLSNFGSDFETKAQQLTLDF